MISHDEYETVRICSRCGTGFLESSPTGPGMRHAAHVWIWPLAGIGGGRCDGVAVDVVKLSQIQKVQQEADSGKDQDD